MVRNSAAALGWVMWAGSLLTSGPAAADSASAGPHFEVALPVSAQAEPLTGRVFVLIAHKNVPEVRLQDYWFNSPQFLGRDVKAWRMGEVVRVDETTPGYPFRSLTQLPSGDYYVQAAMTDFRSYPRADGHTIWALSQWDGQRFLDSPGNLYSEVQKVHVDGGTSQTIRLALSHVVPPSSPPKDTEWVRYVRIESRLLSRFWGRPIYLGAVVLLPKDYASQPERRYPIIYQQQAHFDFEPPFGFSAASTKESDADRILRESKGYESGYQFYQSWIAGSFPRVIAVALQHPTPYGDLSAAINSENNGPYGDAIVTELIPYLEEHFRVRREPQCRILIGKSAGGRDALALQVHYPKLFGGAWIFHPWPFNYRRYFVGNIYTQSNAFELGSPVNPLWEFWSSPEWAPLERAFVRTVDGQLLVTNRDMSRHDQILWGNGPGGEFGVDDAVNGPRGDDGYPKRLFDRATGQIDPAVAAYWREHSDLVAYTERNWTRLAPQLSGKLHFFVGEMDQFYRNYGVHDFEETLKHLRPAGDANFEYAPLKGHGWQPMTNAELVRRIYKGVNRTDQ